MMTMMMQTKNKRRSGFVDNAGGGVVGGDKGGDDLALALASAIGNGEDLGPIIRQVFELGKPEALLQQLKQFVKRKEMEIEDLCRVHYEEFIHAVDELRGVLVDADELKNGLGVENNTLQRVGSDLLGKLEELLQCFAIKKNMSEAIHGLRLCSNAMDLCVKYNHHSASDQYYPALKTLDMIERQYVSTVPARELRRMVEKKLPVIKAYIEKKVNRDFNDWLVQIRGCAKEIGQLAIGQASAARQREEDLRGRQRQAEEQSRTGAGSGIRDCAYSLYSEDSEEDSALLKFDLGPVYRAHHINTCLGLEEQFQEYYYKNRELQLNSDLQISSVQPFLESHQVFFSQIAGFFIVEDRVLRTAGGLISAAQVEMMWDTAVARMGSILEDHFSRMQVASHLLLIKDYVSLLGVTLKRYGYSVTSLLEVLDLNSDKYHELLLNECRAQINDVLANDKYEQMVMRKEYEYTMNMLAFHLQTSDIMPAFPYIAPFSATVPDCCRIVRSFIEDSVSYLSYGAHLDFYEVVKKYLDKLLINVLNEALLKLINNSTLGVSHAMQIAANMTVFERSCDFFTQHAAQLCGIPMRFAERSHATLEARSVLKNSQAAAYEAMLGLVKSKVDEFMLLTDSINWTPDDVPQNGNEYLNEVTIYLETLVSTAQQILPLDALEKVGNGILKHISDCIVATLMRDNVKRFNVNAIMGIDNDLKVLESFAEEKFDKNGLNELEGASNPKECLAEARQLVNLLLSNQPENFMNPVIREKHYRALDYRKVVLVLEKFRDAPDRLFGSLSSRGSKQNSRKKSLDTLVKRLKDLN